MASTRRTGGTPSVAVIGAGLGGIGIAVRLIQAGYHNLTLFERSGHHAGPGRTDPSGGFSRGVLDRIRFGVEVRGATFDEASRRWQLTLSDGTTHEADLVVSACGRLTRPSLPPGPVGGPAARHNPGPATRRVAVVGTGTNALRLVPQIVPDAAHLSLFPAGGHLRPLVSAAASRPKPRPAGPPGGPRRILLSSEHYPPLEGGCVVEVTEKVIQIRQDGLVTADGVRHRADPVIVATGFTAAEFLAPMIAAGAPGQDPRRLWRDATDSYLWLNIAGLPNLFMLHGVQQPRARRDRLRAPGPRLVVRAVCAGPPQPGAHPDAGARRG